MFTYPFGFLSPGTKDDTSFKMSINTALGSGTDFEWPIPAAFTYDFYWTPGNGSPELHVTSDTDPNKSYDYGVPFSGQVSARGKMGGFAFNNTGDKNKVTNINSWGDMGFEYLTSGFRGCSNLTGVVDLNETINLTSLRQLFQSCPNLIINNSFFEKVTSIENLLFCFDNSNISLFPNLDSLTSLITAYGVYSNCLNLNGETIPNNYFYENKNINTFRSCFQNIQNLVLPSVLFDLSALPSTCNFQDFMNVAITAYSGTGTIQDVWNYVLTGVSTNAFLNQTSITNHSSIPNGWKGL